MKKTATLLWAISLASAMLTGCGSVGGSGTATANTDTDSEVITEESSAETTQSAEPEEESETDSVPETTEQAMTTTAIESSNADIDTGTLSDDWKAMQFLWNDEVWQMPLDYAVLQADGGSITWTDYGETANYTLNSGDKVTGTIDVENSKYDDKMTYWVGFVNNGTENATIENCDVWSLNIDISYGFEKIEGAYPEIVLSKGITWGCSAEEITTAYGEPSSTYDGSEHGYQIFTYEDGANQMELKVFDSYGLAQIKIQTY